MVEAQEDGECHKLKDRMVEAQEGGEYHKLKDRMDQGKKGQWIEQKTRTGRLKSLLNNTIMFVHISLLMPLLGNTNIYYI